MAKADELAFIEDELASCHNPHMRVRRRWRAPAHEQAQDNQETTQPEHGFALIKPECMTSEPVLPTLGAAGPPRSSRPPSSRCLPRIASSRWVCPVAPVRVTVLVPLGAVAGRLPPPRPREQGPG